MFADDFRLFQNYPNPFNAQTIIQYQLFKPARVKLDIYNIEGALVRSLFEKHRTAGYYRIVWDRKIVNGSVGPSCTYLGRFQIGNKQHTIRMQLVK